MKYLSLVNIRGPRTEPTSSAMPNLDKLNPQTHDLCLDIKTYLRKLLNNTSEFVGRANESWLIFTKCDGDSVCLKPSLEQRLRIRGNNNESWLILAERGGGVVYLKSYVRQWGATLWGLYLVIYYSFRLSWTTVLLTSSVWQQPSFGDMSILMWLIWHWAC